MRSRLALRGRDRLGLLRPVAEALCIPHLHGGDEIRSPAEFAPPEAEVSEEEMEGALALRETMAGERLKDLGHTLKDHYTDALIEVSRKLGPAQSVALPVAGTGGVPATGASAVVLNVTATNATAATYLAATTRAGTPTVSKINLLPGGTVPNLVVVPVVDGQIFLYNHAGSTGVIVDVFGYCTN
ncbi:hypothetical protein ACGF1Z_35230 [Streptomyces sp. NPDC048018]|uniref:hypothetical protein n=1 Tax=Streptomyces sp. NPDC048018 TaxID=3365499 RepID=UPI0037141D8A